MIKDYWLIIGGNWFTGYNGSACVTSIDAHSLHENEEAAGVTFKKVCDDLYGANLVHLQLNQATGELKLIPSSEYEAWKASKAPEAKNQIRAWWDLHHKDMKYSYPYNNANFDEAESVAKVMATDCCAELFHSGLIDWVGEFIIRKELGMMEFPTS